MDREGSKQLFEKARRHSRIVRILRVVLPTLVAIAKVGIFVSTYLNPLRAPPAVGIGSVVISGTKITMDRPHMSGFTNDGRAYEVKADAAVQDVAKPDMLELHKINAKVEMQDRSTVHLISPRGTTTERTRS